MQSSSDYNIRWHINACSLEGAEQNYCFSFHDKSLKGQLSPLSSSVHRTSRSFGEKLVIMLGNRVVFSETGWNFRWSHRVTTVELWAHYIEVKVKRKNLSEKLGNLVIFS